MKKTIAILLVLVIAGVGLFAADANLSLTTSVSAETQIYVSAAGVTNATTYETFMANVTTDAVPGTTVVLQATPQTVGKLHYMTNAAVGVGVKMSASLLSSPTPLTNTKTIGYSVDVNGITVDASALAATESAEIGFTGAAGTLTINAYDIAIELVEADYLNAPADTYNANIYFNFVTV